MHKTIIIGGGIIGCAILYMLDAADTILLEAETLASQTSGQSGGFIRRFSTNPLLSDSQNVSYQFYKDYAVGFTQTGMRFCLSNGDIKIETEAGCINTTRVCQSLVAGKHYQEYTKAISIVTDNHKIIGVNTTEGFFACEQLILAAGASTTDLLAPLGLDLGITNIPFTYHRFIQAGLAIDMPSIDYKTDTYLFPLPDGNLIGGFLEKHTYDSEELLAIYPHLRTYHATTHTATDAFAQDEGGLIYTQAGLIVATGFSGGGIKQAPYVAQRIKSLLNERT